MGNILTKNEVYKIGLKQKGASTLGGRKVWFDKDILRLNYDGRGDFLGEFQNNDFILVVMNNGEYYTTNTDLNNHYDGGIIKLEKYDKEKIWTALLYDEDQQGYLYIKRFCFENSNRKQNYLGDNKENRLALLTDQDYPRIQVVFGGNDSFRDTLEIDAEQFISVKSFKAKGKRVTTYIIDHLLELEPLRFKEKMINDEEPKQKELTEEEISQDPESNENDGDVVDEITGQLKLF